MKWIGFLFLILCVHLSLAQKQVAITFDDLILGGGEISLELTESANEQIIASCKRYNVPAIGFVNEQKLFKPEEARRIAILKSWVENGLEVGNHTFSHPSLNNTPLDDFKQEVLKGEIITRPLMSQFDMELKYFRHPFLNTGPDILTKAAFEAFLDSVDYQVAPVTVESSDYIFNKVYLDAYRNGDSTQMKSVGEAYVSHTLRMFDFMDSVAHVTVGRQINHIFLCHANHLNATYIDQVYDGLVGKGYEFISMDEALEDPVYQSKDYYVGPWGMSWLYRWDKEKTTEWLKIEPEIDKEILTLYQKK